MTQDLLSAAANALSRRNEQVYFVQIGAMDGESFDPIFPLVRRHGWHGLLVEPMPHHFEKLKRRYSDCAGLQFSNVAVGEVEGNAPFYYIDPQVAAQNGLPDWTLGISSFFEEHVRRQQMFLDSTRFPDIMAYVSKTYVETVTLEMLLARHPLPRVDALQIDAEGFDYRILKQWDFARQKPAIINIEFARLSEEEKKATTDLLHSHGYAITLHDLDMLALRPELLVGREA